MQFYAATAGRESAELVALSLGIETVRPLRSSPRYGKNTVAQLVALHESSLPLVATVLTLTISVSGEEFNLEVAETEATAVAAFLPGTALSVGQGLSSQGRGGPGGDDSAESEVPGATVAGAVPSLIAPWQRFVIGLDEAFEQFQRENPNGVSGAPARDAASDRSDSPPAASVPAQGGPTSLKSGPNQLPSGGELDATEAASPSAGVEAIDAVIRSFWGEDRAGDRREQRSHTSGRSHDVPPPVRPVISYSPWSLSPDEIVGEPKSSARSSSASPAPNTGAVQSSRRSASRRPVSRAWPWCLWSLPFWPPNGVTVAESKRRPPRGSSSEVRASCMSPGGRG